MKLFRIALLLLLVFTGFRTSYGQYQMLIQNGSKTSATTFEFDVYIVSTGADFTLTSYQTIFTFNNAVAGGGALTFSYVGGSALGIVPLGQLVMPDGAVQNLLSGSTAGTDVISTTPRKLGRFRLTNTVAFANVPFNLNWDFAGDWTTLVNINNNNATVAANHINALSPYRMIALNDLLVSDKVYEFDVAIVRTDADFTLTSYQVAFTYNSAVVNGGTVSFAYIPATSTLTSCTPLGAGVFNDGGTSNLLCGSTAGSQLVSSSSLVIGRFRVTNSVPFALASMNVAWDFAGNLITQININNTDFTVQANHSTILDNIPLPVELVSFTSAGTSSTVHLKWKTATELNNFGFDIERRSEKTDWLKISFIPGHGSTDAPSEYAYTDKNPLAGKVQYRLKQIDASGKVKYYDAIEVAVAAPTTYKLMQNSPNPFNPSTSIKFQLPVSGIATITVYDMLGREVVSLLNENREAGTYSVEWNGRDARGATVASGVYLYRLTAGKFIETKKMNLMK